MDKIKSQLIDAYTTKLTILMEQYKDAIGEGHHSSETSSSDEKHAAATTSASSSSAASSAASSSSSSILSTFYTTFSELSSWLDIHHKDQRKKYLTILNFADQYKGFYGLILKR